MLSTTAQYALRALVNLSVLADGETVLGRDLAQKAAIPANYLSKILLTLGGAGIITATRGNGGGYRLQRRPEDVRLLDVVHLFDKARTCEGCLLGGDHLCADNTPCEAHEAWRGVRDAYLQFLETTTLATLAAKHAEGATCSGSLP